MHFGAVDSINDRSFRAMGFDMIEKVRTWSAIIALTLFRPLPVSFPVVWLAQGELHMRNSVVIKAAEQPALFYLIILIGLCNGLAWTCLSLTAALNRFRLISRR